MSEGLQIISLVMFFAFGLASAASFMLDYKWLGSLMLGAAFIAPWTCVSFYNAGVNSEYTNTAKFKTAREQQVYCNSFRGIKEAKGVTFITLEYSGGDQVRESMYNRRLHLLVTGARKSE